MAKVTVGYQDGCLHPLWITRAGMRVARALGASAIWVPDHFMGFAPKWMWTPYVVPAGKVLHSMDALFDPVPIMTLAALKHRNVWIGTSVTEPIRRHPMSLAQTFVTLDHISSPPPSISSSTLTYAIATTAADSRHSCDPCVQTRWSSTSRC